MPHYLYRFFSGFTGRYSPRDFHAWMSSHAVKRGGRVADHLRAGSSAVECTGYSGCSLDETCRTFFSDVLGISADGASACDEVALRLRHDLTFCVTGLRNRGSYGIVLGGITQGGERIVIKVCNLSLRRGVNLRGDEWLPTRPGNFDHEVHMLAALNLCMEGDVPRLHEAGVVKLGLGAVFGTMILEDTGGANLQSYMTSGARTLSARMRVSARCGASLRRFHECRFCHGDLHAGNIMICDDDDTVKFVDVARSMYTDSARFRFFDRAVILNAIDNMNVEGSHECCVEFLAAYYGNGGGPQEKGCVDAHMKTVEELSEMRGAYMRALKAWRGQL